MRRALRNRGDRLHRRADAQELAGRHAALGAAGASGDAPDALFRGHDLVVGQGPAGAGELEAVAHLDALDGLDAHQGAGEPGVDPAVPVGVRAEPGRQAVDDDLDDAAEGVAVLVGGVDLGHHRGAGVGVEAAHRVGVQGLQVVAQGHDAGRRAHGAELDDVRHERGPGGLLHELGGDLAERHACGGLAGAGPLEHRAGFVEAVLLHADEVGVAGTRTRERCAPLEPGQRLGVDRIGRHDLLPLGPLAVADAQRDRAAERGAVADAADDLQVVGLEAHPGTASVAQATAGERGLDVLAGHPDARRQSFEDGDECGAV